MNAKRIFLCAFSEDIGDIVYDTIEGPQTEENPATVLHNHKNVLCILDAPAAQKLTRFICPWTINGSNSSFEAEYDEFMTKKAVAWLSEKTNKFIMSLDENDYRANGLLDLLLQNKCSCAELNFKIWSNFSNKITDWPVGGAPPNWEQLPFELHKTNNPKKVIIFSPHPDDDVICMGATMEKLNKQGHEVFVAYQTSGAFAVMYDNVIKNLKFAKELTELMGLEEADKIKDFEKTIIDSMASKEQGTGDERIVQTVKALSRQVEAHQAAIKTGVKSENIFNIDLPFYHTGAVVKKDVGEEDMQIHKDLLNKIQPDHIFCAGDLTDPHGTHRKCLEGLVMAINELKKEECEWLKKAEIWFYRGAWQEWEIEWVDLAVTLTEDEIYRKRMSIFQHDTQKDPAPFYGMDPREFWQRIEARNSDTGKKYTKLGIVNCPALEVFVNYRKVEKEIVF